MDSLTNEQLIGVVGWRDFYKNHEVYKFIGLLEDERYYTADGKPTPQLVELNKRLKVAEQEEEVRKKEREIKRKQRREAKARAMAKAKKGVKTNSFF